MNKRQRANTLMTWVDALRSGKYQQGRNVLCSTDGKYCCLGVLGEILGKLEHTPIGNGYWPVGESGKTNLYSVPTKDAKELGISDSQVCKLISMNDTHEKNFNEIADYIEENLIPHVI